jgi:hypothetical protein
MSAGKFTHLRYDPEAYAEEINRSTDPLLYRLDPNFAVNCNKCFAPYGPRAGQQASDVIGQQTDIDSILRGISKINTKSNRQQMPTPVDDYHLLNRFNCSDNLESEYTRYTYPSFDIRGLNVRDLRFDYPLFDPQCQIFENFEVNTKLQAKDNHRAIWQTPLNQRDLFPVERLGQVKNCRTQTNCNYAPFTA